MSRRWLDGYSFNQIVWKAIADAMNSGFYTMSLEAIAATVTDVLRAEGCDSVELAKIVRDAIDKLRRDLLAVIGMAYTSCQESTESIYSLATCLVDKLYHVVVTAYPRIIDFIRRNYRLPCLESRVVGG